MPTSASVNFPLAARHGGVRAGAGAARAVRRTLVRPRRATLALQDCLPVLVQLQLHNRDLGRVDAHLHRCACAGMTARSPHAARARAYSRHTPFCLSFVTRSIWMHHFLRYTATTFPSRVLKCPRFTTTSSPLRIGSERTCKRQRSESATPHDTTTPKPTKTNNCADMLHTPLPCSADAKHTCAARSRPRARPAHRQRTNHKRNMCVHTIANKHTLGGRAQHTKQVPTRSRHHHVRPRRRSRRAHAHGTSRAAPCPGEPS